MWSVGSCCFVFVCFKCIFFLCFPRIPSSYSECSFVNLTEISNVGQRKRKKSLVLLPFPTDIISSVRVFLQIMWWGEVYHFAQMNNNSTDSLMWPDRSLHAAFCRHSHKQLWNTALRISCTVSPRPPICKFWCFVHVLQATYVMDAWCSKMHHTRRGTTLTSTNHDLEKSLHSTWATPKKSDPLNERTWLRHDALSCLILCYVPVDLYVLSILPRVSVSCLPPVLAGFIGCYEFFSCGEISWFFFVFFVFFAQNIGCLTSCCHNLKYIWHLSTKGWRDIYDAKSKFSFFARSSKTKTCSDALELIFQCALCVQIAANL